MRISQTKLAFAAVLLAGAAMPVLAQQDSPESILPPGFDNPAPAPAPAPRPAPAPAPGPSAPTDGATAAPGPDAMTNSAAIEETPRAPVDLAKYELPEHAEHSLARIGINARGNPPFPANAFGASTGRYLTRLMHRVDAPIASRWVSIALRRALQSRIDTPKDINGADFAAERAWLLLRMGESIAARGVVQDVDIGNYTPWMFRVSMQSALASADPGGLCAIAEPGAKLQFPERGWAFSRAMCAGLAGEPSRAGQLFDQAAGGRQNIDILLAEKVMGAGAQGRRAVTIEWDGVDRLSAWRWGLATASGVEVPADLYRTAGPQVLSWLALAPGPSSSARANAAELAATQGVFSGQGLIELYGEIEGEESADSERVAVARDLRTVHTGANIADRMAALTRIWDGPTSQRLRYARLVLTARASATIPATVENRGEADRLIASMLSAGLDAQALAWRGVVVKGSDGWAMLEMADPSATARLSGGDFDGYHGSADKRKAQMAFAGLAGMGRFDAGELARQAAALGVDVTGANSWTRAIDAAGRRGDSGTVVLLAAAGMQARGWAPVSPEALYHIVAAMRACGLGNYARMVAVEAITRV